MQETYAMANLICAIVSAKWALELGFSQFHQILFLIGGLFIGPIMLFILYIYLIRKASNENSPGGKMV